MSGKSKGKHLANVHQYEIMGLNFSNWTALVTKGTMSLILSGAGKEDAIMMREYGRHA